MTATSALESTLDAAALQEQLGLANHVIDEASLQNSVQRFAEQKIVLPTFMELAEPHRIPTSITKGVDKNAADPRNLFRVHWYNDLNGERVEVPDHVVLPSSITGIDSPIIVVFGDRFPMITAHKVLAAYSCFAPRVITGQFDPTRHRAVWPSTGNYARGGIAISRLMSSRGVAVLPAGMSQERFDWLDKWVADPADIVRTPGTESNVKEIYDACNEMAKDPGNFILNQFCEFGNPVGHYEVTGRALAHAFEHVKANGYSDIRLAAFTSATGSAGTISAGDRLKDIYGTKIVAVEALECPTMLENGFGEHNIQGIGDKHIPLIHNVMNTDVVVGVSDRATDELDVLFNTPAGQKYLAARHGASPELIDALTHFGFSSICNVLAAIKTAKLLGFGANDAIVTVATDGSALYPSERVKTMASRFNNNFTEIDAAEVFSEHLGSVGTDAMIDCTERDRNRIFNLGYYTWVEQQGTPLEVFEARRSQSFWKSVRAYAPVWDELITEFNARVARLAQVVTMAGVVTGLECSVCGAQVSINTPLSWRCPNSSHEDRQHVLRFISSLVPFRPEAHQNPFLAYRRWLAVDSFGESIGLTEKSRIRIIESLNNAVTSIGGVGFHRTPLERANELSAHLGFSDDGGIWIKDETHHVAGSHKARHLMTEMIHLLMAEEARLVPWTCTADRPPLAIASCGNAAIAASTIAAAVQWPISVHVPVAASAEVVAILESLHADIRVCPRLETDPPGDPCVYRFRELTSQGAIPFGVQGTENAWCLDGGRTIGWEILEQMDNRIDRVIIQVGGGAFASSVASSFKNVGVHPKLHAVQAEGCAPLARAWIRAQETGGMRNIGERWSNLMWPWESEPQSLADGILDDETYDWIGVVEGMADTGGSPIVASEMSVVAAYNLAHQLTSIDVSPTGSAGLAGVLECREHIEDSERIVVVFSGVRR